MDFKKIGLVLLTLGVSLNSFAASIGISVPASAQACVAITFLTFAEKQTLVSCDGSTEIKYHMDYATGSEVTDTQYYSAVYGEFAAQGMVLTGISTTEFQASKLLFFGRKK